MPRDGTVQTVFYALLVIICTEQRRPINSLVYLSANDAHKANQECKDKNHEHSTRSIKEARLRLTFRLFQHSPFQNRRIYFCFKFCPAVSKLPGHACGDSVSHEKNQ